MRKLIFFFLLIPLFGQAEIFRWSDEKGRSHYSDQLHAGAKTFEVKEYVTYYPVAKVYDGDTILLLNGNKIRFSGVNTPEVEGRNKPAQIGGDEAKRWLQNKLQNQQVRLEVDVQKKDKYGRLLAHVFTQEGHHINLELVKQGLASVNIFPPNVKYAEALLAAQRQAEESVLGIWHYQDYKPKFANQIQSSNTKGWARVVGTIESIKQTKRNNYLKMSDTFRLKINNKSLSFFPELESYLGKKLEARGWLSKQKNNFVMFVRHPSALKVE